MGYEILNEMFSYIFTFDICDNLEMFKLSSCLTSFSLLTNMWRQYLRWWRFFWIGISWTELNWNQVFIPISQPYPLSLNPWILRCHPVFFSIYANWVHSIKWAHSSHLKFGNTSNKKVATHEMVKKPEVECYFYQNQCKSINRD